MFWIDHAQNKQFLVTRDMYVRRNLGIFLRLELDSRIHIAAAALVEAPVAPAALAPRAPVAAPVAAAAAAAAALVEIPVATTALALRAAAPSLPCWVRPLPSLPSPHSAMG